MSSPNRPLLEEIWTGNLWFPARKTRPIWAKPSDETMRIQTREGPVDAQPGDMLCRGEAGDVWVQSAERVAEKYCATDDVSGDGWRKYTPRDDAGGVMAAQIDREFQVTAQWGTLHGRPGDYVVKNHEDREVDDPEDVWIVGRDIFEATYERVHEAEPGEPPT